MIARLINKVENLSYAPGDILPGIENWKGFVWHVWKHIVVIPKDSYELVDLRKELTDETAREIIERKERWREEAIHSDCKSISVRVEDVEIHEDKVTATVRVSYGEGINGSYKMPYATYPADWFLIELQKKYNRKKAA